EAYDNSLSLCGYLLVLSSNLKLCNKNKTVFFSYRFTISRLLAQSFSLCVYKDKAIVCLPPYSGRVSFGQKHASSTGLKEGDVTLKLEKVTVEDAGKYTCYVSSDKHHDRASVNLIVKQLGASPLLTPVLKENNQINMSCESDGWYPEPQLQWSSGNTPLTPEALVYRKASSGLFSVHSWMIVPSSSALSCSVGLPGEKLMQRKIDLNNIIPPKKEGRKVNIFIKTVADSHNLGIFQIQDGSYLQLH
uniref:Ig-like domain-containing protein n=1 Tax=Periophthalmus magnuspinnatus TaxID=409849 RepID=A0A3B3ZCT4_9GOBI